MDLGMNPPFFRHTRTRECGGIQPFIHILRQQRQDALTEMFLEDGVQMGVDAFLSHPVWRSHDISYPVSL